MQELVSIVMPNYNGAQFLADSIRSVLGQTYVNWELLLVDDCSSDDSIEIIEKFIKIDLRIKLIKLDKNSGPAVARNRAIKEAKGKYIAFLDSDDLWFPNKLEKQIEVMEVENILFSYGSYSLIDEKGKSQGIFKAKNKVSYEDMLKTSEIGTLTMIYNADELGKHYFLDVGHEDYVMKLQVLKEIEFAQGISEPLAKYRVLNNSLSRNKFKAALWQWKIYREIENLSFLKSIYYFTIYAYNGIKNYV